MLKSDHRRRKNGAAREAWQKAKQERNARRPKQQWVNIERKYYGWIGRKYLEISLD